MAFRLIVSDELHFAVHFTLADGTAERAFGARLSARRCPGSELDERLSKSGQTVAQFLEQQGLQFLGWTGDSPLKDEEGRAPAPGAEGLQALMGIGNMSALVMSHYMVANGAKGKAGN